MITTPVSPQITTTHYLIQHFSAEFPMNFGPVRRRTLNRFVAPTAKSIKGSASWYWFGSTNRSIDVGIMNVDYLWAVIEITEHGIYSSWWRSVEIWATKSAKNFGAQITLVSFQHPNIFESLGIWSEIEHPVNFLAVKSTYLTFVPGCVTEPSQIDEGNLLPQNSKWLSFRVGMSRTLKIIP